MELLAPAGSFASFDAALEEGADAIYVGAPGLNARALARDFSYREIGAMIESAHRSGVRLYIAMNSLVKENELDRTIEGLAFFENLKPDGLIIQDLGLYHLARTYFPDIPLHASTLMHCHNGLAVTRMIQMGFKRVVLPRELTLEEIGAIYQKTQAELEVFVHGAMCFSFSGLCLFSSLHGGKSSLRGQCVQPCRRRYSLASKKGRTHSGRSQGKGGGYLFSMNDLSGIDLLHELKKNGVHCLKLEGRLKSAEYVRNTVKAYRIMLDSMGKHEKERQLAHTEAKRLIDNAMGRRRSSGFFRSHHPDQAITPHLSGNVGKMVGWIKQLELIPGQGRKKNALIRVSLRQSIQAGERFRLHDDRSGERVSFTLRSMKIGNRPVRQAKAGNVVTMTVQQDFAKISSRNFKGSLFKVDVGSSGTGKPETRRHLAKIQLSTRPVEDKIKKVLKQLPALVHDGVKEVRMSGGAHERRTPSWWIRVNFFRDMKFRFSVRPAKYVLPLTPENVQHAVEMAARKKYGSGNLIWSLPPVIMDHETDFYIQAVNSLVDIEYNAFMLGHFTQKELFSNVLIDQHSIRLYGDYTLNLLNSVSLVEAAENGLSGGLFSIETDAENLAGSMSGFFDMIAQFNISRKDFSVGIYVFGHPPLFTSRIKDNHFKYGKRVVSPRGEDYSLSRLNDITLARATMPFSTLDWWRDMAKMGVDYFYVDLTGGNFRESAAEFTALYSRKGKRLPVMTGNYIGGLV